MGRGRARVNRRIYRLSAVALGVVLSLATFSVLDASAWVDGNLALISRSSALVVDTGGPLGLSVPISPLAAGDIGQRTVTLRNPGLRSLAAVALTVTESEGQRLRRNAVEGLAMRIDRCTRPWKMRSAARLFCPGRRRSVVAWRPLATGIVDRMVGSLAGRSAAWLRVSLRLPTAAPPEFEALQTHLRYRFISS